MSDAAGADDAVMPSHRARIDRCLAIEGMTSAGGLALMDLFVGQSVARHAEGAFVEFGAYKGRASALFAHHAAAERPLLAVEQSDYLQLERLQAISPHVSWHKGKSEAFCPHLLPQWVAGRGVIATHHDASHFFDNLATELEHVAPLMHRNGVIVLGDFADTYSQVRAAYYHQRYARRLPFELLLVGFNKGVLVHEAAFDRFERFVLNDLLWELKKYRVDATLVRTDIHAHTRAFFVRPKGSPAEDDRYGRHIWGERFYAPSNEHLNRSRPVAPALPEGDRPGAPADEAATLAVGSVPRVDQDAPAVTPGTLEA